MLDALAQLWSGVGGDPIAPHRVEFSGAEPILPSTFPVGSAAAVTVAAGCLAAAEVWRLRGGPAEPAVRVDVREAAIAFRSERYLRVDGAPLREPDPLTTDYRCRDGWVRLHCNYPAHRAAALRALEIDDAGLVAAAVSRRDSVELEDAVHAAGGAAAALRSVVQWAAHPQAAALTALPLVDIARLDDAPVRPLSTGERPLSTVRVLDLTRVIAGPVAGRTLAAHGADVLRVGADHLALVPSLIIDTGFGKRFCHLDLRDAAGRAALRALVAEADVVLQAFRPGALERLGFGPQACAALRPGLVYVDICAWGHEGPWRQRRGFDSLVQMAAGIADEGRRAAGDAAGGPRPLPAQALDHATGFLAAFAAVEGLRRRATVGGSWHAQLSLARTGMWLSGLGRIPAGPEVADPGQADVADLLCEMPSPFGELTYLRPPGTITGAEPRWETPPHRPGADPPIWW